MHEINKILLFNNSNTFFSNSLVSKTVFINQNTTGHINLSDCISYTVDSLSVLSYEQLEHLDKWQLLEGSILKKPINDYTYWYKIQINNSSDSHILIFDYPIIDFIDSYYLSDSGLINNISENNLNTRFNKPNLFKLPKGSYTCYIRLKNILNFQFPIKIISKESHFYDQNKSYLFFGFYFGILILLVLIHLMNYVAFKERIYLTYLFYLATVKWVNRYFLNARKVSRL